MLFACYHSYWCMRILSLNAWHGTRYAELKEFLSSQLDATDIFCFQESNGGNIEGIIAELFDESQFSSAHASKATATDRYYSLHTFVKKPLQILQSEQLFSDNDAETGQTLAVKIGEEGAPVLSIVNIHGVPFLVDDKLDTDGRLRQSETIISWLSAESTLPAIVCGDFNLLPETNSIKKFESAGYKNLIADYNIPTTRNRLAWERHPDSIQLFADYTFTSPGIKVLDFSVPDIEVSDHLPMSVGFSLG